MRLIMGSVDRREYQEQNIGFSELADKWIDSLKAQVKPSTIDGYQTICNLHLKPYFRNRNVRDISTADIEAFIASKIGGKLSNKTVGYLLGTLKTLLKKAVIWNYAYKNVAEYVKRPKAAPVKTQLLSSEQVDKLLNAASGQTRLIILTGVLSGLRAGEICALRWSDIDLVDGIISVTRDYVRGRFDTPKSRASIRQVIIPPALITELAKHKPESAADDDLVFSDASGNPIQWYNFLHRKWEKLLKKAHLPKVKFHSLRHNYASILLAAGEDLTFIQRQVGHGSLTVTLNVYSHLLPNKEIGAGQRIQNAFTDYVNPQKSL